MEDEQDPVLHGHKKVKEGHEKVKVGHEKVKARYDSKRNPLKTSNKEYNDIAKMLNDNNVSNADACKKMTEIEDRLNLAEESSVDFSDEDVPDVGIEENIYF